MITRINLLPQEYRKKEMTPIRVFLPAVAGMAVVVAAGFFWGWLHFAALASAENERDALNSTYASKVPTLDYLGKLRREEGEYKKRADTITQIAASRTLWTRKLDQLCNVIVNDDGGERYLIRVDELDVSEAKRVASRGRNKGPKPGETVKLKGYCFNDEDPLQRFNNFHEAIKQSPFFMGEAITISKPEGNVERPDEGLIPSKAWTIDMEIVMKGKEVKKTIGRRVRGARASAR